MTNLEKYNEAFVEALEIEQGQLVGLTYNSIVTWDSIGHMALISALEKSFSIPEIEMDDMLDIESYENGFAIIAKYGVDFET